MASDKSTAPWRAVPAQAVVSVEHPCIIKNVDKGIKSLGGMLQLDNFLQRKDSSKSIGASLRPDDSMAKPIMSTPTGSNNVLLKVTVPKRTGRKRKRGSNDPFMPEPGANGSKRPSDYIETEIVIRSLRDNASRISVQPVGHIEEIHRFRSLPDFQYASAGDPLMEQIRDNLVSFKYSRLNDFQLRPDLNISQVNAGPSPEWSQMRVAFPYAYLQVPGVSYSLDESGQMTVVNTKATYRNNIQNVPMTVATVPAGPGDALEPEESVPAKLQEYICRLRVAMEKRPIMTKRVIRNLVPSEMEDIMRQSLPYVGYTFKTGPWKGALVKYGVDPRTDAKYRVYQTMTFQIMEKPQERPAAPSAPARKTYNRGRKQRDQTSHLFDGKGVSTDGKIWHVCDITDPILRSVLDTENIRSVCDIKVDGWYHNGTWAMARIIMKDKIQTIQTGGVPDDAVYARIVNLPAVINDETVHETFLESRKGGLTPRDVFLSTEIRNLAKGAHRMEIRAPKIGYPGHVERGSTAAALEPTETPETQTPASMAIDAEPDDSGDEAEEDWNTEFPGDFAEDEEEDAEQEQEQEQEHEEGQDLDQDRDLDRMEED